MAELQDAVLAWFAAHGRDLPWRRTRDPYAILVAETMLQQTQVDRVIPRWERFLARFPTIATLAAASTGDVLREWSGLGYNCRAVRLHQAAIAVKDRFSGVIPSDSLALRGLPGIGPYTAAAVACFAFEQPVPMVDTNHRRFLGRLLLGPRVERQPVEAEFAALAASILPEDRPWAWNQALMDIGATICTAASPACGRCPARSWCASGGTTLAEAPASYVVGRQPRFEGSNRQWRGRIVRRLTEQGSPLSTEALLDLVGGPEDAVQAALLQLEQEGLVANRGGWTLP